MSSALPLGFEPPRVYVLHDVWDVPEAARRAERICAACEGAELRTFSYDELPDIVAEENWTGLPRMGELETVPPPIPVLGLFRFDDEAVRRDAERMRAAYRGEGVWPFELAAGGGAFSWFCSGLSEIKPNPQHVCRPQWRLHQGRGCPHQCAYCSLGGYLISHLNTEHYIENLAQLLGKNRWQKTYLYDDVMDVLTLEPQHDSVGPLMRFFATTGDRYIILHEKSDRVEAVIEADAPSNTIVVWSLAGPTQSRLIEPGSATTEQRIEAARRCQEAGVTIRYKFKPFVPVRNWREEADYTIELLFEKTRPDNLSLCVLMWMDVEQLKACIRPDLLDPDFLAAAEQAADQMKDQKVGPFPEEMRETIYRYCLRRIREHDADIPVTMSTESLSMWKRMGADFGFTPASYVCGCGAPSTPWKKKLEKSPWQQAKKARTLTGESVLEQMKARRS